MILLNAANKKIDRQDIIIKSLTSKLDGNEEFTENMVFTFKEEEPEETISNSIVNEKTPMTPIKEIDEEKKKETTEEENQKGEDD
jgi:hypothetical protein